MLASANCTYMYTPIHINYLVNPYMLVQLELELDTLKSRLDSLRKAKNTTIVRRDREQVRISSPKLGRRLSSVSSLVSSRPSTTSIQRTTPSSSPCHHGNLPKQIEELRRQVISCFHLMIYVIDICYGQLITRT